MSLVKKHPPVAEMEGLVLAELPNRETTMVFPTGPILAGVLANYLTSFHLHPMIDPVRGPCAPSIFDSPEESW